MKAVSSFRCISSRFLGSRSRWRREGGGEEGDAAFSGMQLDSICFRSINDTFPGKYDAALFRSTTVGECLLKFCLGILESIYKVTGRTSPTLLPIAILSTLTRAYVRTLGKYIRLGWFRLNLPGLGST